MESFILFLLGLLVFCGILAGFYVLSHLSLPQRDYSDDWRAEL